VRATWAMFAVMGLPLFAQVDNAVSLTIRFTDGKTQFHAGEVIPVELTFSASVPDTYDLNTRDYDRSGRLNAEAFHVTPPGRDPLRNYYANGLFMFGGLGSLQVLTGEAQILREELNEWVALDRPGHYTLYVTTHRVSRRAATTHEPVETRSNSLEFDVLAADPAWQQQVLTSAVLVLDNDASTDREKIAAIRSLRFLDSTGSVQELVRQMGKLPDGKRWDCVAGLAGSLHQSLVVRELELQIGAPDEAISGQYLSVLAKLKVQLEHELLPAYPEHDQQQQRIWRDRMQAQAKEITELDEALYRKTAELVSVKQGVARAETVRTLLLGPAPGQEEVKPLAGLPEQVVAAAFLALPADQQWTLLSSISWERLKIPAMVAPLERVVEQPVIHEQMLRDEALRRLYELDPREGRPRILEEITHPHIDNEMFTVKIETLGLLPEETMPHVDQLLAGRLEQKDSRTRALDAQLIGRYATKTILPRVKAVYEAGLAQWDCATEDGFVLYFLRVQSDYGIKRVAQAPSVCMANSLPTVIRMNRWSEVEPAIIGQLNGPDLNRARQAAETLARYGSPAAEEAMWKRLRSFHEQWAENESDLHDQTDMPRDASDAISFQFGLVEALGRAQAWVLSDEQVTELENLTLGQERENVQRWHWRSPVDLTITLSADQHLHADINHQYSAGDIASLARKLAQFKGGTHFSIAAFGPQEQLKPALRAVDVAAAEHRLIIEKARDTDNYPTRP
jgi:hypothetical protein